jgi:hypothetical protein
MITRLLVKTIQNLVPNKEFVINDGVISWIGETPNITQQQIDNEYATVLAEYNEQEYARKRAPEYPPLTDLADALYHQSKGDETKLTAYLAKCEAVKQKYPKE